MRISFNRVLVFLYLSLTLTGIGSAQVIQVIPADLPPYTPVNLIQNIFLGGGIQVLNIKYSGVNSAVGYFTDGMNDVGIERGIIMTTGLANGIIGPNLVENFTGVNNSSANDPDIAKILDPLTQRDVAIYEIEFIPFSDSVQFKYAFASEEYPEYSCSPFNDVFGFFISGPGINGPFSNNAENIALIPGTNTPVSINTVHPSFNPPGCIAVNGQYYNSNAGSPTLQYDGVLDVFTAQSKVTPCQVYKMKLVIADASDQAWDSGVFLEAKSFGAGSLSVEATTVSLDGAVSEGCSDAILTFKTQNPVDADYPIDFKLLGVAQNGIDYTFIDPTSIFIPKDSNSVSLVIHPLEDGIIEGTESILVDIRRNICFRDTFAIAIKEKQIIAPVLPDSIVLCVDATIELDASVPILLPQPDTFRNNTPLPIITISDQLPPPPGSVPTISEITVLGIQPTNLTAGMINSVCLNITHNWDDDLDIFLVSPAGQAVELSTDNGQDGNNYTNTCFTEDALNKINAPGPFAPASAAPFTGKFLPEGPWSDLYDATYPANGTWGIYVKDDQNGFAGQLDNWSIIFNPVYKVKYEWLPTTDIDCPTCAVVNVSPDSNTTYIVKATDTYGCEVFDTVLVKIEGNVEAPVVQCESSTQTTLNFAWPAVAGAISYEVNINGQGWISPNPGPLNHFISGLNLNESVTIEVRAIGSCISSSTSATCTTDDCDNPVPQIISLQDLVCPNDMMGGITLIGSGGNVPYQFKIGTEVNTTGAFTGLDGGNYTAQIIDATGCIGLINFTLLEPDPFVIKPVIVTPLDCSANPLGAVTIDIKGGTQPYQFDWSNLQTDSIIVGLNPGTYYVTVTDAKLCQVVDSVKLFQNIPSLLINVVPVKCFGDSTGSIQVTVSGGTLPLNYAWSGPVFVPGIEDQLGLPAGIYMVTVTDAVGCTKSATIPITQPATAVTGAFAPVDTICGGASNGMTEVFPQGGTFPYSVSWSNNVFNTKLSNLSAGNYVVTIIDGKGCRWVDSTSVFERDRMKIGFAAFGPLCFNGSNGSAEVTSVQYASNVLDVNVLGYVWNTIPPQLTRFATNLNGGQIYSVTVTDLIGCEGDTSILIPNPPAIMISTDSIRNLDCANDGTGYAAVSVNGGNGPFQYLWDNAAQSQNTPEALDLDAGTYQVTVTDASTCTMVHQVEVTQPDPIDIQISEQPLFCLDQIVGSAAAAVNGGSPPYDISWSNGSNGPIIGQLTAGDYIVTVEDGKGCISVDTAHILYLGAPIVFDVTAKDINCFGAASGQLVTSVTAGLGPLQFSTNGINYQSSPIFGGLGAGDYRVYVRDVNGCIDTSQQFTLAEPDPLALEIGPGFTLTIGSDTILNSVVLGGTPAYEYIWTSSDSSLLSCYDCPNPIITPYEQTGVQLTVIDQNGCIVTDALTIGVRLLRYIFVPSGFSPDGDGVNDLLNIFSPPGVKITEFKIFDRWGEMLFYAPTVPFNDTSFGWDGKLKGKPLNPAVFVWSTEVEYLDGRKESISGTTTLLR